MCHFFIYVRVTYAYLHASAHYNCGNTNISLHFTHELNKHITFEKGTVAVP